MWELETSDEPAQGNNQRDTHIVHLENGNHDKGQSHGDVTPEKEGFPAEVNQREWWDNSSEPVDAANNVGALFGCDRNCTTLGHVSKDCVGVDHDTVETGLLLEEAESKCNPGGPRVSSIAACLSQSDPTGSFWGFSFQSSKNFFRVFFLTINSLDKAESMGVISGGNVVCDGVFWVAGQEHNDSKSLASVWESVEYSPEAICLLAFDVVVVWKSCSEEKGNHDTARQESIGGCSKRGAQMDWDSLVKHLRSGHWEHTAAETKEIPSNYDEW